MNDQHSTQSLSHRPHEYAQLALLGSCLIWQSLATVLGLIILLCLPNITRKQTYGIAGIGLLVLLLSSSIDYCWIHPCKDLLHYLLHIFKSNVIFWKLLFQEDLSLAFYYQYHYQWLYNVSWPLFIAGLMKLLQHAASSPHKTALLALNQGKLSHKKELSNWRLQYKLKRLKPANYSGITLGVSTYTGHPVVMPDEYANQVVLVLGTTGGGKTVTLEKFYERAIQQGYPLIIVNGKPMESDVATVMQLAQKHNRTFYGFNCGNYTAYNPLASGGYTELKDKIISLKDRWENDYYLAIAQDYLQTTLEVLLKAEEPFDLSTVSTCLDFSELAARARKIKDTALMERVKALQRYEQKDLTGLQAHLNLFIHSELGQYLCQTDAFNLNDAINNNAVVYFALPALKFSNFSQILGKLVINDLKAIIDNQDGSKRIFTVFDEFSVFAGEQVLHLVNMGRGKGVHAILGTQGLADLQKVAPTFESQVLNCANTILCHRLNDQDSAEKVATWIGTVDEFDVTAQISTGQSAQVGSIRRNKSFIIHPDEIKQCLKMGEAFYVSKLHAEKDKVKVRR